MVRYSVIDMYYVYIVMQSSIDYWCRAGLKQLELM